MLLTRYNFAVRILFAENISINVFSELLYSFYFLYLQKHNQLSQKRKWQMSSSESAANKLVRNFFYDFNISPC